MKEIVYLPIIRQYILENNTTLPIIMARYYDVDPMEQPDFPYDRSLLPVVDG
jgi:hypothetical protein